jgi:hypothetical protein
MGGYIPSALGYSHPIDAEVSMRRGRRAMTIRTTEDIYTLVKAFENRTITKSEWTHSAHLAVGLYYCRTLPFAVAKNVMRDGIHWLNDRHGTPNTDESGYHETLTVFWLKRIWNFLDERADVRNLATLANELIERFNDPDLPLKYYTRELLFSASARREYVTPDRRIINPVRLSITFCTLSPLI